MSNNASIPANKKQKSIMAAVKKDGLALESVPSNKKNKSLCTFAVSINALALEYVPNRFKSLDLCTTAVHSNWRAFLFVPESMYALDRCLEIFRLILHSCDEISNIDQQYIKGIVRRLPEDINSDFQIIRLERQLGARHFKKKFFDEKTNVFITTEYICYREECEIKEFENFIEFYEYVDGNLKKANLYAYNFKGIHLKDFNIEEAFISSDVLVEHSLYDNTFYRSNIRDPNHASKLMLSVKDEIVEELTIPHELDSVSVSSLNDNTRKLYYISDIHLNHKLLERFPSHATKQEISSYIYQIVKKMISSASEKSSTQYRSPDYLLIAGDVSYNYEISELFYSILAKLWTPNRIVVVLGNHELWNIALNEPMLKHSNNLDEIIYQYRVLFSKLKIKFLHNELLVSTRVSGNHNPLNSSHNTGEQTKIISEKELATIEPDKLKEICTSGSLTILGSLGFSGKNSEMNSTNGLYKTTISTLDQDIAQTTRFENIYKKMNHAIDSERLVILTHMPKENWSDNDYNQNWIYVNGHTHRNHYQFDDEKVLYADNQIGYLSKNMSLKYFSMAKYYDIFRHYTDGIYSISKEEYVDFNRGSGIEMEFNRTGKIHMLKRQNIYCFLHENPKSGTYCLLNGGTLNKLEHVNIIYYYDKMSHYANAIKNLLKGYQQALKFISNSVKAIGGKGTVHGCIVDIDFWSHIHVNPDDGTITPYFALSPSEKWTYISVESLLGNHKKELYDNYMELIGNNDIGIKLLNGEICSVNAEVIQFISDTSMYKPSRVMRSLQYLADANIIRVWNDQVIDKIFYLNQSSQKHLLEDTSHLKLP